jgi:hypothetical protein
MWRSLLTLPGSFGILRVEPNNSSEKVHQHLKRGSFFGVRTLKKYGVYSVISGREWANTIPCKGEYARRSQTVVSSRPFLRPAEGQLTKSERFHMFRFFLSSRYLRLRHRLLSLLSTLAGRAAATFLLTSGRGFGNAGLPQTVEGVADALFSPKLVQKSGHFCFCHQRATGASCGRGYILAGQRPGVRETPAAFDGPGSVVLPFFVPSPLKNVEVPMFRFLLSSRWTRFQYRLVSSLQSFLCRAAATAVFGAVLALPVLYFVEVL